MFDILRRLAQALADRVVTTSKLAARRLSLKRLIAC